MGTGTLPHIRSAARPTYVMELYAVAVGKHTYHKRLPRKKYLKTDSVRKIPAALQTVSKVFLCPKADNRFKAVDAETLCEHIALDFTALPLLIGIVIIGF